MPYEWMKNNMLFLDYPGLPPIEMWCSRLKSGRNLLELEYVAYKELLAKGLTQEQALDQLALTTPPKPAQETLDDLRAEFTEKGFKTFKDYLLDYLYNVSTCSCFHIARQAFCCLGY